MASLFANSSLFNPEIKDGVYQQGLYKGMNVQNAAALNAGIGAASSLVGSAIGGGYSNNIGNAMQSLSGVASAIPGVGTIAGAALNVVGGLANRAFGSKMDNQKIAEVENNISQMRGFNSNAGDFDQFMSEASAAPTIMGFDRVGKDGWFSHKARRKARQLRAQQAAAAAGIDRSLENNVDNLIDNQYNMLEANYAAFGGNIEVPQDNTKVYKPLVLPIRREHNFSDSEYFWDSGFEYPAGLWRQKDGTFRTTGAYGKDVFFTQEEADSIVRANKAKKELDKLRSVIRRPLIYRNSRPAFMPNSHAFGGHLNTHGADWSDGFSFINNGDSHEANPYGGVQMGIAPDGEPNYVEEGEVIFNDYVFSDRLRVPKAIRSKYKLRGKKDMTFAEAAKNLQKESEEMPNDPITKRGTEVTTARLANAQEAVKAVDEFNGLANQFGLGGNMFFADGGKIHIAPSKKGTFTAAAKKHSMGVQEFASKVLANKDDYSPAMVKKANFARNAAKWHADGGHLYAYPNPTNAYSNFLNTLAYIDGNSVPSPLNLPSVNYQATPSLYPKRDSLFNVPKLPLSIELASTRKGIGPRSEDVVSGDKEASTTTDVPDITIPTLFYAPAITSGIQAFTDTMGWTNKPDYSSSNSLTRAASGLRGVRSTPIGDYMAYRPLDRLFMANQLAAQAGATRRNVLNTSGGNRGAALAGILAADYNAQNALSRALMQAEEYNLGNKFKTAEFNRGTNQYNAQNSLAAQEANTKVDVAKLKAYEQALAWRDAERRLTDNTRAANLTNFANNLGNVGLQMYNNRMLNWLKAQEYFRGLHAAKGGKLRKRGGTNA